METRARPTPGETRRSALVALLSALLVALALVRCAPLSRDGVLFGVDTASVQAPWRARLADSAQAEHGAAWNPALADQGVVFYPYYRWVSESLARGELPLWCPLVYAGAPGMANLQCGALDPQVLAPIALEHALGRAWFDWGLSCLAWLRIAAALLGAFLLARRLGLPDSGAALSSITFGLSGYVVLWLNHPLGHVAPLLPWVLYFVEGVRGAGWARSMLCTALSLLVAILGGHPETAFFVGATGGIWSFALLLEDRRAGLRALLALAIGSLSAGVALVPFYEYLQLSAAMWVREQEAAASREAIDLVSLGCVLVLVGIAGWFALGRSLHGAREPLVKREWIPAAIGVALACVGAALFLATRSPSAAAALALVPDHQGAPGGDPSALGYRGEGNFLERASPWIPMAALALALAATLAPSGKLRRRKLVLSLGVLAFLLSIELPGLLELWRWMPIVGLGDTVRLASVGSLLLGLAAGDALSSAPRASRVAAVLALAPLVVIVLWSDAPPPLDPTVATSTEEDELVGFTVRPPERLEGEDAALAGFVHPSVPVRAARLAVVPIDARGQAIAQGHVLALELVETSDGGHAFRAGSLPTAGLPAGHWRFTLELLDAQGQVLGTRRAGVATISRPIERHGTTLVLIGLALAAVMLAAPAWIVISLALAQGLHFGSRIHPFVERAAIYPETETERILARELGPHRFLTDPGVLPPDTGLVRGLRAIEGYDALDPLSFNEYRWNVLPAGVNGLLAWNARGVDLEHPAFRLYGVKLLVCAAPLERAGWTLIASPQAVEPGLPYAETWIYRCDDPLPRAFVARQTGSLEEIAALVQGDRSSWNPLELAASDGAWRPVQACTRSSVSELVIENDAVSLTAELDGDGLLVLTDQAFPGWKVFVDGVEGELVTADMIFRGVPLHAGRHEVVFRYQPRSVRIGLSLSLAGLAGLSALGFLARRQRSSSS